ncbi:MAG: endonuclease/exonuclease/phosphatase family protein [Alphaproteobacteria bacterium]|nr:endonuclease/exonuclease/phosphatase family protein [Alphaproteobacteria bacterium]
MRGPVAMRFVAALLPLILLASLGGVAAALPEDILWLNAGKATLLSVARLVPLAWLGWAWVALRARSWLEAGAAVALVVGGVGVPAWPGARELEPDEPALVVLAANAQAYADGAEAFEADLAAQGAQLILTHEMRGAQVAGMRRVADNYERPLPRPSHGAAVYCAEGRACWAEITGHVGPEGCAMPVALARVGAQGAQLRSDAALRAPFCAIGVHAPPPVPICAEGLQPYVEEIARHVSDGRLVAAWGPCPVGDPVVVTGDFNYVPGTQVFRTLEASGLRDPAWYRGLWAASWPAGGGWPDLPLFRLDHVLAGDLEVSEVRWVRLSGSDHKAVRFLVRTDISHSM